MEGDLHNAAVVGNASKIESYYKKLTKAKQILRQSEADDLEK